MYEESLVKNIKQKEKIIWSLQCRIALAVVGFKTTCVALYSTFKGWVFQAKLPVQCTSNNSLHVKYAFGNSCIGKWAITSSDVVCHLFRSKQSYIHWHWCTVSWVLGNKFQWNFKLKEFSFMKLNLKRLTSKWWPFCLCLNMLIKSYYCLIIAHNMMI